MKLQFKHQKFQADAAKAVVDVFAGQPYLTPTYMMDRGTGIFQIGMNEEDDFTGWRNQPLVPELSKRMILEQIQEIQRIYQITPSQKLEGEGYNLTIEMETGVGKTYTYIKTMFELNKHYGWSKFKGTSGIRKVTKTVSIGFNLYDQSNGMEEYHNNFVVKSIDGRDDSVEFLNGIKIYAGDVIGKVSEEQLRRIQIRETILSHIERERQLYYKGIKVLSLFFIDEVAHYKQYDETGESKNGIFADMFEEEYRDIVENLQMGIGEEAYFHYLNSISAESTHAGYFSIDKKVRWSIVRLAVEKPQRMMWMPTT